MTWFHFRLMKTGFLFFVADHLLVGQLCTTPKSDRRFLSCLKVTQCSTREIRHAPLYNSCSLPIQLMTTGPLSAPSKCKSGLSRITGTCLCYSLWCGFKWGPHHATSHLLSRLESQHQSVPGCAEEHGDAWCNQVSGGRPWVWKQDSAPAHRSKETHAWFQKECYDFVPFSHCPPPEPAGLLRLVIRREHHQHELPQHQSQPNRRHSPSIRRAPAGACGKCMLPVPDPYRRGDWGWSRLHGIDVSSTT